MHDGEHLFVINGVEPLQLPKFPYIKKLSGVYSASKLPLCQYPKCRTQVQRADGSANTGQVLITSLSL
jgi:hypothetical protein